MGVVASRARRSSRAHGGAALGQYQVAVVIQPGAGPDLP